MPILLGGVLLDGFQAPGGLQYGGAQSLAVHRLPGGSRIIDAMGPDDADIAWHGFISGADAADRARQLDVMRQAGSEVTLAWDTSSYLVVISRTSFTYWSAWWIGCDIVCTIVSQPWTLATMGSPTTVALITSDLSAAGAWTNVAAAYVAIGVAGAVSAGTQANAAALSLISVLAQQVSNAIAEADTAMNASSVASLTAAAGTLAELTAARGYIGRANHEFTKCGTLMQTITVCGGTLFDLACIYLDDATQWNRIATLNQIYDPWLAGLVTLTLPAFNPSAGGGIG